MLQKMLLIFLSLGCVGLFADGVQPAGSGTEADPYQVATLDNLLWVSTTDSSWTSHFIQTANIYAAYTQNWNDGEGFSPIGVDLNSFHGNYDGQNHTIASLYINRPLLKVQGLFGKIYSATIENLGLTTVDVTGYSMVGGLVGICSHSTVNNCYSVGCMCGTGDCTGGLVGRNSFTTVSNCYSAGNVSGGEDTSGLVGWNVYSTISNCYSTGSVSGTGNNTGGLAGWNYDSTINNCYSTGSVNGAGDYTGGLIGRNFGNSTVSDSFWDMETSGQATSAAGTGLTTAEMQTPATFTDAGWDFVGETANGTDDYWDIDGINNDGYPYLSWQDFVGIDEDIFPEPETALQAAFPNPFNPTTTIKFSVQAGELATLEIFNLRGQLVKLYPVFRAGKHEVIWDGADNTGNCVASGVYFYRLQSDTALRVRKMLLLK